MLDLQRRDPEFQRGGNAVGMPVGRIGRHDVRHVADDEQFTRAGVEDDFGRNPRVAAADHHHVGRLPGFRERAIAILLAAQMAVEKDAITFNKTLRKRHELRTLNRAPQLWKGAYCAAGFRVGTLPAGSLG